MEMVSSKLKLISSPLQFKFKANSSCSRAIFTLKYLCNSGSILAVYALGTSKAFNTVNVYDLKGLPHKIS